MEVIPETYLNQVQCSSLVKRLLEGQNWTLTNAGNLSAEIWQETAEPRTEKTIKYACFRHYAAILHHHCYHGNPPEKERAWFELRRWLARHSALHQSSAADHEEIIQETLLTLQTQQPANPKAFFAFALTLLKNSQIDLNRRQTAEKRGGGQVLSLEALAQPLPAETVLSTPPMQVPSKSTSASPANWRTIESTLSDTEQRRQLIEFVREYLPTDLQRQVFEAHFLDGLKPGEIARLMDKQPHEIRLLKARTIKKLKALPEQPRRRLLAILDRMT